jgi:hypothetical protein
MKYLRWAIVALVLIAPLASSAADSLVTYRVTPQPWVLTSPGATPADRWFGAYHKKENTAALIARAYKALKIPEGNIRVFTLEAGRAVGDNPYHLSMVGNATTPRERDGSPSYGNDWRFLLGRSAP